MAAIYHFKLYKAILVGFRNQMKADGRCKEGFIGMMAVDEDDLAPMLHAGLSEAQVQKSQQQGEEIFRDDMTGQLLIPELVMAARMKELE